MNRDADKKKHNTSSPSHIGPSDLTMDEVEEGARLMEESFLAFEAPKDYKVGEKIKARITSIEGTNVFLDVGVKSEAIMMLDDLLETVQKTPEVGQEVEAYVLRSSDAGIELGTKLPSKEHSALLLEQAVEGKIPVEGKVTGKNKGGLEVDVFGKKAFCPISQIDVHFCEKPETFIGQKLRFYVTELKEGGKKIVLSRRQLLEEEQAGEKAQLLSTLEVGAEVPGTVRKLEKFGAFVDIGFGVEGLLHVSEISHLRIENPQEALTEGQSIRVAVKSFQQEGNKTKIGLSMKSLQAHPWDDAVASMAEGTTVSGKIVRLQPFGAFAEISPGVDGLIHISELAHHRVRDPKEIVSEGDVVNLKVIQIDRGKRKIGLSLKQMDMSLAPKAVDGSVAAGSLVEASVETHEDFGMFVKFSDGQRALLPYAECDAPKQTDYKKLYPAEAKLEVLVLNVDEKQNRIRVSQKAAKKRKEEIEYQEFQTTQAAEHPEGFGTFANLLKDFKAK